MSSLPKNTRATVIPVFAIAMRHPQSSGYAAPSALKSISSCPVKAGPLPMPSSASAMV